MRLVVVVLLFIVCVPLARTTDVDMIRYFFFFFVLVPSALTLTTLLPARNDPQDFRPH
jgi:hypothetical protein